MKFGQLRRALAPVFAIGEVLLCESQQPYVLEPGHGARRLACPVCGLAIGGAPARIIAVITGAVCPTDEGHLLGAAHLRHDACPKPSDPELAQLLVSIMAGDD